MLGKWQYNQHFCSFTIFKDSVNIAYNLQKFRKQTITDLGSDILNTYTYKGFSEKDP